MNICSYGCGNHALYKLKNGKYCCEPSVQKCPAIRLKNSHGVKKNREYEKIYGIKRKYSIKIPCKY